MKVLAISMALVAGSATASRLGGDLSVVELDFNAAADSAGDALESVQELVGERFAGVWEQVAKHADKNATACWKETHFRGMGRIPKKDEGCTEEEEKELGLCYKKCAAESTGYGPFCWDSCPGTFVDAGAVCCESKMSCAKEIFELGLKIPYDIVKLVIDAQTNPIKFLSDLKAFIHDASSASLPVCK